MPKVPVVLSLFPPEELRGYTILLGEGYQRLANAINNPDFGTTAARPTTDLTVGQFYFDTTLGKPIWYGGTGPSWVDATGASV